MEEQRLSDKQHQGEQQPYCHHCVHPPVCHQKKTVPEIEPNDHVEAGSPGKHRCDASLPAKRRSTVSKKTTLSVGAWRSRTAGSKTVVTKTAPPIHRTTARTWRARASVASSTGLDRARLGTTHGREDCHLVIAHLVEIAIAKADCPETDRHLGADGLVRLVAQSRALISAVKSSPRDRSLRPGDPVRCR